MLPVPSQNSTPSIVSSANNRTDMTLINSSSLVRDNDTNDSFHTASTARQNNPATPTLSEMRRNPASLANLQHMDAKEAFSRARKSVRKNVSEFFVPKSLPTNIEIAHQRIAANNTKTYIRPKDLDINDDYLSKRSSPIDDVRRPSENPENFLKRKESNGQVWTVEISVETYLWPYDVNMSRSMAQNL